MLAGKRPTYTVGPSPSLPTSRSDIPAPDDRNRWFQTEVQPHGPRLKSYLQGSFPAALDVEDVVQESFLRVWQARAVQEIRSAKAFLFTVARRLALDSLRHGSRSPFVPLGESAKAYVIEDRPSVVETVDANERIQMIVNALVTLPPRCREVVVLLKLKGLSRRDVGACMGISEKTVDAHYVLGIRKLENYLRERGVSDWYSL